ncbi:MAG: guanylate kinase [Candidatus Omnitrophota bacterium]
MKAKIKNPGKIFIISGPSGSGKTTLLKELIRQGHLKKRLVKSVSLTTRPPRPGERQGRDYIFVSRKDFQRLRQNKKILEWTRYLGYYYATPRDRVENMLAAGKHILLCLDLKGALKVKRLYPEQTVTIFVMPPSIRELYRRIRKRCCNTKSQEIARRLELATVEMRSRKGYDYCLMNKDFDSSLQRLKDIVFRKQLLK